MSGNAVEEGLFRQIANPSHTDPARAGFLASAVVGFIVAVTVSIFLSLSSFWFVLVWVITACMTTAIFLTVFKRRKLAREAQKLAERRNQHEMETRKAIEEMQRAALT